MEAWAADTFQRVGGRDIFNPVEDYAPPPAYYAPMPDDDPLPDDYPYLPAPAYVPPPPLAPNISVCGDIGRRINGRLRLTGSSGRSDSVSGADCEVSQSMALATL